MSEEADGRVVRDVAYLAGCAARGEVPDAARVARMDLDAVYRVSSRHLLVSACAMALEAAGVRDERLTQARGKAIRKSAAMDVERARLLRRLDEAGIWYLPLKGCVLQGLYPSYGMRQMSDNDILIDPARAADARRAMEAMGFVAKRVGGGVHDVYHKEPVCNFELHRSLFAPTSDRHVCEYYRNVETRLLPDGDGGMGRHLSAEDFYVYVVAHAHKHFSAGGIGLRSLLDTYVYLRRFGDELDWGYVVGELGKLGIADFEERSRRLANRLLDGEALSPDDEEMLAYMASSGAYGTMTHKMANQIARHGRGGYLVRRAFPPLDTMSMFYPVLGRVPALLPACWALRLVAAVALKPRKVARQLRAAFRP